MNKLNFEELLGKALSALVESNGGSLESALDDMGVTNKEARKDIKEWFGWDDDDVEEDVIARPCSLDTEDEIEEYARNYLEEEYGYEVESFDLEFDAQRIYISNIVWKEEC